jgi:RNA polymerase sigma-32 factor
MKNGRERGMSSQYATEVGRYPVLTRAEEQDLARLYRKTGNVRAAETLITSNLRFVVKVAYEYQSYGLRMADVIQEGNLGLIQAVAKFDPSKDIRLISYAVWWIRAYVQNYILKNWSLVRIGTTQAQRKLFFSLGRTRRQLEKYGARDGERVDPARIARMLKVRVEDVTQMEQRMAGNDLSLDAPIDESGGGSHVDSLADGAMLPEDIVAAERERNTVMVAVKNAMQKLDPRERFIVENRLLTENPITFSELGQHFGVSRERARQLELRAIAKLQGDLKDVALEAGIVADSDELH